MCHCWSHPFALPLVQLFPSAVGLQPQIPAISAQLARAIQICRGGVPQRPSPWESPTRCWRRFVVRLRRDGGRQGSCMGQYGTWSMTESDDTSTRFCSCTKTTSQLSEDIMHVIICTYMHVYIRIHCTGILGGVEPCFQLVPCKHHCNHGARQVHLAYFGHWAWCQNVDNCQEPQN